MNKNLKCPDCKTYMDYNPRTGEWVCPMCSRK